MTARFFITTLFSLLTLILIAGEVDGIWRSRDQSRGIEVMNTHYGIRVRSLDHGSNTWETYSNYGANRYKDQRGNCYTLIGGTLEWCTPDRRNIINYTRSGRGNSNDWNERDRSSRNDNYNRSGQYGQNDDNDRNWSRSDRDNWNAYYKSYEGKWHNHSTGTRINVDLTRRSLRIKFKGERWYEVIERSRGLFVDQRGNEFSFRGDVIEYRAKDGDLLMRFFCDTRCDHRDDYRTDYFR
ncbi:MAG: hypothetical protein IPO25_02740 [Saprospiraceae bacterium]|nr:hypothetical protein [Saprospiraceae bacterium]